ncbi:hypothetical protein [Pseudoalteromonas sp. SMS1]|nr:hypothetical protein [Pseudoalteromonas sp. SMS1]
MLAFNFIILREFIMSKLYKFADMPGGNGSGSDGDNDKEDK